MERGDEAVIGAAADLTDNDVVTSCAVIAKTAAIARLDRATQDAAVSVSFTDRSGTLGHPLSRVVATEIVDKG
ncbi:MAG TPA: hypothetical protein VII39_03325 [Bradyrhizobium sp.]|jgi:hypothetical protein